MFDEQQIFDALELKQYAKARLLWIHSLEGNSAEDKEKNTFIFLSHYFVSDLSEEWSKYLTYIWRDIRKIWPNSKDYLKIYSRSIDGCEINDVLKEKLIHSLLHYFPSHEVVRLGYKIAPKGGPSSNEALVYMLSNINHALQNTPPKIPPQNFNSLITSDILRKALQFSNEFPPLGDPWLSKDQETDIVKQIELAINDKYDSENLISEDIPSTSEEIAKLERDNEKIAASIWRHGGLSGITLNTDNPSEIYKIIFSYYESLQKDHSERDTLIKEIPVIKQNIADIKEECQNYIQRHQSPIIALVGPFGYVSKPIERFLAYGQNDTNEVLKQSLLLLHERIQRIQVNTAKKLPHWFISEFEKWWFEKTNENGDDTRPSYDKKPLFVIGDRLNEIQIFIPQQKITGKEGLHEAGLIVYDETGLLLEQKIPLYRDKENSNDLISQENFITLISPSPVYTIEMTFDSTSSSWSLPGFSHDTEYIYFDYGSHRQIMSKEIPRRRFILLTNKTLTIRPATIILEKGQFFGNWDGFNYFVIEPSLAGKIPISIASGDAPPPKLHYFEVQVNPDTFDKNLIINEQRVILGAPPSIGFSFDGESTLLETIISIHPHPPCSQEKPIFLPFTDFSQLIHYDIDNNTCHIDLSDPTFLGSAPWGHFTIRIQNKLLKTDARIECLFLPGFSYKFSKSLYLPEKHPSSFVLNMNSPCPIEFKPESDIRVQRTKQGLILTGKLISEVRGNITYRFDEKACFSGEMVLPIPQLVWRFDDEINIKIWPIQRSFQNYSDTQYFSFGTNIALSVFFPATWDGTGTLSMDPEGQYIIRNIVNGRGKFILTKFYDTLTSSREKTILFSLTVIDHNQKERIQCPLFEIERWRVKLSKNPVISTDASGNRTIDIIWRENYPEKKRSLIIWKQGRSEALATKVHEEKIPDTFNRIKIRKSGAILSSDNYYLHFFKVINTWDASPVRFPGEIPNVFKFRIEVEDAELLAEADTLFNQERYVEAVSRYKKYEEKHPEKGGIWKQEILNKLIYPFDYPKSIRCFKQLLDEKQLLKETDHSFVSQMLVNNLISKPHLLSFPIIQWMFYLFQLLIRFQTPKLIICAHFHDIEKGFESIEDLTDEQIEKIKENLRNLATDCENNSKT